MKVEFVDLVPADLEDETIYVSISFATVVHRCACGCGQEVVTPLSPTDWKITYNGESVTLFPSIGNWGFECRSHYWIENNDVKWADSMSQDEIEAGRRRDRWAKARYFDSGQDMPPEEVEKASGKGDRGIFGTLWAFFKNWWR